MRLVGLDLSLAATGVAIYDDDRWAPDQSDQKLTVSTIKTIAADFDWYGWCAEDERIWSVVGEVADWVGECTSDMTVCIEGLSYNSKSPSSAERAALHYMVRRWFLDESFSPIIVPPATLKKFATGKGNATKVEVISAARERLGYERHNDNEADARWLLEVAMHLCGHPARTELPKTHLVALEKL